MSDPPSPKDQPVVEPKAQDTPSRASLERSLHGRIRQQEILAELGVLALQGAAFQELIDHTARLTAEGLNAEFCKVLEYQPRDNRLLVRAGVGWDAGVVGKATVGADLESPAGFALRSGKPVISNHLENEQRFRTPELLLRYGIRRAMNVILQGDGSPFGVLEVDSRSEGEFGAQDIAFLQGAANLLGMAIERQRFERNLKASLERYEVLLKEANHRVMNSLQLVASLLNLQADAADDEALAVRLRDAASRVSTIARAHQRLYRSDRVKTIDLGAYLGDVCRDLQNSGIGCEIRAEMATGLEIATDRAIPIALIATELVTNTAKHATVAGPAGGAKPCTVQVRLAEVDGGHIVLSVSDDGAGLPPDFDIKTSKGLGMRIVGAFTRQLDAVLDVQRRSPGTAFVLTVPLEPGR